MRIGELLEKRRQDWAELEKLCDQFQKVRSNFRNQGDVVSRFSALYRSACSDLAMSDVYQLPPTTVEYLHRLVGRAHNQLYRSNSFRVSTWATTVFETAPRQIFGDGCVQVCSLLFFGLFILSAWMGVSENRFPEFAHNMVGNETIDQMETMYEEPIEGNLSHYMGMGAFYIQHNTSIGLQCFGLGPLILPSLCSLCYNAVQLGTIFGYMSRSDVSGGDNFLHFVTAHGPFELTAIVLSAAAGLRLGVGLLMTAGLRRFDSLRLQAQRALPVIMTAVILFILAAFTEGFISPSPLPYPLKALWSIVSSGALLFYFVVLGFPRGESDAT